MKYFLDTEFIEDGHTIDLISIGIVAEDGREYYAVNSECGFEMASDWVWRNVLYPIGIDRPIRDINPSNPDTSPTTRQTLLSAKKRQRIKEDLLVFFAGGEADPTQDQSLSGEYKNVEVWGEWCSYDWVALCQLFGTMMDLPHGFPMRCRDVIQMAEDELKIPSRDLPKSLETDGNHHALLGAKTVMMRYEYLAQETRRRSQ